VILPTMLLLGLAMALIFPALNVAATSGVADKEQGLASGLVNTSIQLGGAVVLAIVTAAISAGSGDRRSPQALLSGFHPALLVVTAVSALGLLVALSGAGLFTVRDDRPREQHLQTD